MDAKVQIASNVKPDFNPEVYRKTVKQAQDLLTAPEVGEVAQLVGEVTAQTDRAFENINEINDAIDSLYAYLNPILADDDKDEKNREAAGSFAVPARSTILGRQLQDRVEGLIFLNERLYAIKVRINDIRERGRL